MADRSLIFPAQEYRDRVARLQAGMALKGLEALLLTSPADLFYTTGFLTRFWESPARPWFVIVPQVGDPIAVIPSIGSELMGRTWVTDIRTWQAPDPADDGISLFGRCLVRNADGAGSYRCADGAGGASAHATCGFRDAAPTAVATLLRGCHGHHSALCVK